MTTYEKLLQGLKANPKRWLVTGCAGFIGSNLIEQLLKHDQIVTGLDNFATGYQHNLDEVQSLVTEDQWSRFEFIKGSIVDLDSCHRAADGVNYVLHQAALGSVPRSVGDPIATNNANVTGFLNMLVAARDANVRRFVYASSSSVYGDHPDLPKSEKNIGNPLSPYAVSKRVNELYADQFATHYGLECRGLRYFNVFGARQDPGGAYAAVIPKWVAAMIKGDEVAVYGDGETSRDFCYVTNVVQANLLAAATPCSEDSMHESFNIAVGDQTSLNELHAALKQELLKLKPELTIQPPVFRAFRTGDVRHSLANIQSAYARFGYSPTHVISEGLVDVMKWYTSQS